MPKPSNWIGRKISKQYKINREICRQRDQGCCIRCLTLEGLVVPAAECDHFIPVAAGGTDDLGNLWMLCGGAGGKGCHGEKTQRESNGQSGFRPRVGLDGWQIEEPDWLAVIEARNQARWQAIS